MTGKTVNALWLLIIVILICANPNHARQLKDLQDVHDQIHTGRTPVRKLQQGLQSPAVQNAPADDFAAAPACGALPNAKAVPDQAGRLWGWVDGHTCAFKDAEGHVLFAINYQPSRWLQTPACITQPFPNNSVADSRFKVWGWEGDDNHLCAFKDDHQQPIPLDGQFRRLSWFDAPACLHEPLPTATNSQPDNALCLWGWQLDRNCAYKNDTTAAPLYYQGYNQSCNTTASSAADAAAFAAPSGTAQTGLLAFSAAEGDNVAANTGSESLTRDNNTEAAQNTSQSPPGGYTSVGRIGNKNQQAEFGAAESVGVDGDLPPVSDLLGNVAEDIPTEKDTPIPVDLTTSTKQGISNSPKFAIKPNNTSLRGNNASRTNGRMLLQEPLTAPSNVIDAGIPNSMVKAVPLNQVDASLQDLPVGWCDGGPGGLAPPNHRSRSMIDCGLRLPESRTSPPPMSFGISEGANSVPKVEVDDKLGVEPTNYGLAGPTLPSSRGLGRTTTRLGSLGTISISEQASNSALRRPIIRPDLGDGHTISLPSHMNRRKLAGFPGLQNWLPFDLPSTATAAATATATAQSKGGLATSFSVANSIGNSTSVSVTNATSAGTGASLAVGIANATNGQTSITHSHALSTGEVLIAITGEHNAVSIVDSTRPSNASELCVLSGFAINNKTFWSCTNVTDHDDNSTSAGQASNGTGSLNSSHGTSSEVRQILQSAWLLAPKCHDSPSFNNSVSDTLGRLWGYDVQQVCAFRDMTGASLTYPGLVQLDWMSAPACPMKPKLENSMPDEQFRLWGYLENNTNCAFKDENPTLPRPVYYPGYFDVTEKPLSSAEIAQYNNGAGMMPSAAGPSKPSLNTMQEVSFRPQSTADTVRISEAEDHGEEELETVQKAADAAVADKAVRPASAGTVSAESGDFQLLQSYAFKLLSKALKP